MGRDCSGYLHRRLLKLQVGFLLSEGPGNSKTIPIDIPQRLNVDQDLYLESLSGSLTLTRTKEGILVQGTLRVGNLRECDRCLENYVHEFAVPLAELFAAPPDPNKCVFSVDSNGEIDLARLLREEVIIEESYRAVCRDNCRGLSAESGVNLNYESDTALDDGQDLGSYAAYDPRLSVLKQLLDETG